MRIFAIAVCVLALAACGSEESGTIETPEGTVEYTAEQDGDQATFTATTEEGEVRIASGTGQKVELPEGFSLYPDATVVNSSTVTHAEGSGVRVTMETEASVVQVAEYYRRQARAAGITDLTEMTGGGQVMIGGKREDGTDFSVTASGGEDATIVNLLVAKGF